MVINMKKELSVKQIYDDFKSKIILSEIEEEVLTMYIKDYSIVKIADKTMQSTSTVSRIISEIKLKYNNYKNLEIAKLNIFKKK